MSVRLEKYRIVGESMGELLLKVPGGTWGEVILVNA